MKVQEDKIYEEATGCISTERHLKGRGVNNQK